jgi:hypothetical protein
MRFPIIIMLAIILLTPANIHDVAWQAVGQVEAAIAGITAAPAGHSTEVASLR